MLVRLTNVKLQTDATVLARRVTMVEIANDELVVELIPNPEANLCGWERFAHTLNGYEVMGGFKPCADLANSGSARTLTELRCVLFFEARRDRHSGGICTNEPLIRGLLKSIRQKVSEDLLE